MQKINTFSIKLLFIILLSIFLFFNIVDRASAFDTVKMQEAIYKKYGITPENEANFDKFIRAVVAQESNGRNMMVSEKFRGTSTASGFFQMTESTLFNDGLGDHIYRKYGVDIFEERPEKFRVGLCKAKPCDMRETYFMGYTKKEQKLITMAMWERKASSGAFPVSLEKLKKISSDGDMKEKWKIYAYLHHGIRKNRGEEIRQKDINATANFAKHLSREFDVDFSVKIIEESFQITVNGNTSSVLFSELEKDSRKALEKICQRGLDPKAFGLVGFDGGICYKDGVHILTGATQVSSFDKLMGTIERALSWVIGLAFMLAVLAIFWSGFLLLTANGDMNKLSKAKTILINVLIGLFLITAAWMIVDFIFGLFDVKDGYKWTDN